MDSGSFCATNSLCAGIPLCHFRFWVVTVATGLRLWDPIGGVDAATVYGDAELGLGMVVGWVSGEVGAALGEGNILAALHNLDGECSKPLVSWLALVKWPCNLLFGQRSRLW